MPLLRDCFRAHCFSDLRTGLFLHRAMVAAPWNGKRRSDLVLPNKDKERCFENIFSVVLSPRRIAMPHYCGRDRAFDHKPFYLFFPLFLPIFFGVFSMHSSTRHMHRRVLNCTLPIYSELRLVRGFPWHDPRFFWGGAEWYHLPGLRHVPPFSASLFSPMNNAGTDRHV